MDEEEEDPVPLPNVNAAILKKVIQWCTYHKDDPPPPEDDENKEKRTDDISSWDAEFLKVDQGTLFELILVGTSYGIMNEELSFREIRINEAAGRADSDLRMNSFEVIMPLKPQSSMKASF